MKKSELEFLINRFKDYKVPKYIEQELLENALSNIAKIKIEDKFYEFDKNNNLVITIPSKYFITKRKKIKIVHKEVLTVLYEYKDYVLKRYIGITLTYDAYSFDYKVGQIACLIFTKKNKSFYMFKKGIYTAQSYYSSFDLSSDRIIKSQMRLEQYYGFHHYIHKSKYFLKNVFNKYLTLNEIAKNEFDFEDYCLVVTYRQTETIYKSNIYWISKSESRLNFIRCFMKLNYKFNYRLFENVNFENIAEYGVRINYLGYKFFKFECDNYAIMLKLLDFKYDKDYLYKHRNHIVLYNDYLEMRKSFDTKEYPLYPKRLLELHNELSLKIEYEKNLLLENQINKVIKKYKSLEFDSLDFKFFIPSVCQMIDYSNELNLCIKSANYIQKVAEDKCLLLFCEKKDDPSKMDKYACELAVSNDGFKIVQFHGFNNDINVSDMYLDQRERLLNTLKTKLYLRGLLVC